MAQRSPLQGGRALIVEDEIFFALNLEADMHALGFDICDLAPNGQQASQLEMNNQPDVVLMDINLEGGREGIEVARWLRTVCDAPVIFISGYADREKPSSAYTSECRTHRCYPSRSMVNALLKPWRQ